MDRMSHGTTRSLLATLSLEHPEWRPLIALVEHTLSEMARTPWTPWVPTRPERDGDEPPLLDGATITVASGVIDRWIRHMLNTASEAGTEVDPLIIAFEAQRLDPMLFFETAVSQDVDRLDELARAHDDDRGVIRALAPLIAMPMLQACRKAWAGGVPSDWAWGYCPICGGWPALAESRGLDGHRYLRCGACGSGWPTDVLRCHVCGEDADEKLGSLVSARTLEQQRVDVCDACQHYIKTITTTAPMRPQDVVLHDMGTLALDMAALERDYVRHAPACRVELRVVAKTSRLRDLLGLRS
jgi:FdhE protein